MPGPRVACTSPVAFGAMTIRHEGDHWVLYRKDGDRVLGRHDSKAKAEAQERAIQAHGA